MKRNASWITDLSSVIKQYDSSIHHSIKMTPIEATQKPNENQVYNNLKDDREKRQPKYKLGKIVRTVDIKRVFSKGDSTNWSYNLYTMNEIIF